MTAKETATMDKIEMLSRMWIECDPNRQPSRADEPIVMYFPEGAATVPRWRWFEERAKASLEYFEKHGFELSQKSAPGWTRPADGPKQIPPLALLAQKLAVIADPDQSWERRSRACRSAADLLLTFSNGEKAHDPQTSLGDAECDRQERDAHLLWDVATAMAGAQIGGEAAKRQADNIFAPLLRQGVRLGALGGNEAGDTVTRPVDYSAEIKALGKRRRRDVWSMT